MTQMVGLGSNSHQMVAQALQENEKPSRLLDAEIYRLMMDPGVDLQRLDMLMDGEGAFNLPAFTGSLDAAMKLPMAEETFDEALEAARLDGFYLGDMAGAIARQLCRLTVEKAEVADLLYEDPRYDSGRRDSDPAFVHQEFVGQRVLLAPRNSPDHQNERRSECSLS